MDVSEAEVARTPDPKPGSKRPLPGTPGSYNLNTEHQIYNLASPTITQDSKTTKIDHPPPQTPQQGNGTDSGFTAAKGTGSGSGTGTGSGPSQAPALTMKGLAALFDQKLSPVTDKIDALELKFQSTMQSNLQQLTHDVNTKIDSLDERITRLELNPPPPNQPTRSTDDIDGRIAQIEAEIYKLKQPNHQTTRPPASIPAVIGGLSALGDMEAAKGWVNDILWGAWIRGPMKMYCKGTFKGLIWAEFADPRDAAIQHIKESGTTLGTNKVWANIEKPVEDRVPLTILIRAMHLFIKWGIPKELLWVDPDTKSLSYDKKDVLSTNVIDLKLKINFQDDWADWVKGAEWDTLVKDASAGLDWKRANFIKGEGKGEGKGDVHRAGNGKGPE